MTSLTPGLDTPTFCFNKSKEMTPRRALTSQHLSGWSKSGDVMLISRRTVTTNKIKLANGELALLEGTMLLACLVKPVNAIKEP
jgi:hypothetical protein